MKEKNIFVHSFVKLNRKKPFANERRNEIFPILAEAGIKNNVNILFSRYNLYLQKNNLLKKAWYFDKGWKKIKNQKVNLLYYHGKNIESRKIGKKVNIPLINAQPLEQVCDDKLLTYHVFPEYSPKTFLINNHFELHKALTFIKTKKIVLKPRYGSYGKKVFIMDKDKLRNGIQKDTILQEFIDSSNGIKKLKIKKTHDLRIIIIDGKIDHCYLRIPQNGGLISNVSKGAKKIFINKEDVPNKILKIVEKIDSTFKNHTSRIYSADFMVDENKKPWLIEMNSKPGMLYYENAEEIRENYYDNLVKSLNKLL